jgi:hypothetical protein
MIVGLMLCAGVCLPTPVPAQPAQGAGSDERPPAAWTLAGVDVNVQNRWRSVIRLGYLGDVDSRIVITETSVALQEAAHLVAGYVYIAPTGADSAGTSLLRGGATWLPLRGRVAIDNRLLLERRSNRLAGASMRGRDRLRLSWLLPGSLRVGVYGSAEAIAVVGDGLFETRLHAGAVKTVRRVSVEVYWVQRRIHARPVFNGLGLTAFYRIGA